MLNQENELVTLSSSKYSLNRAPKQASYHHVAPMKQKMQVAPGRSARFFDPTLKANPSSSSDKQHHNQVSLSGAQPLRSINDQNRGNTQAGSFSHANSKAANSKASVPAKANPASKTAKRKTPIAHLNLKANSFPCAELPVMNSFCADDKTDFNQLMSGVPEASWFSSILQSPNAFDLAESSVEKVLQDNDARHYVFGLQEREAEKVYVSSTVSESNLTEGTIAKALISLAYPPSNSSTDATMGRNPNQKEKDVERDVYRCEQSHEIPICRQIELLQSHMFSRPQLPLRYLLNCTDYEKFTNESKSENDVVLKFDDESQNSGSLHRVFSIGSVLSRLFSTPQSESEDEDKDKDANFKDENTQENEWKVRGNEAHQKREKSSVLSSVFRFNASAIDEQLCWLNLHNAAKVKSWSDLHQFLDKIPSSPLCDVALRVQQELKHLLEELLCLRAQESKVNIKTNLFLSQPKITPGMREILLDWLVDVHRKFKLHSLTLHRAIAIVDRYLSAVTVSADDLQGIGAAALNLAHKFEELRVTELLDFAWATSKAYSKTDIQRIETKILTALQFNIVTPLAVSFASIYMRIFAITPCQDDTISLESSGHYMSRDYVDEIAKDVPLLASYVKKSQSVNPSPENSFRRRLPLHLVEKALLSHAKNQIESIRRKESLETEYNQKIDSFKREINREESGKDPQYLAQTISRLRMESLNGRNVKYVPTVPTPLFGWSESGLAQKQLEVDAIGSHRLRNIVEMFCEAALQNCDHVKYPPSLIGAAALSLTLQVLNAPQCWTLSLSLMSGYSVADISAVCTFLREWCSKLLSPNQRKLTATRSKYLSSHFQQVAKVAIPFDDSALTRASNAIKDCMLDLGVSSHVIHLVSRLRLDGGRVVRVIASRRRRKSALDHNAVHHHPSPNAGNHDDPLANLEGFTKSVPALISSDSHMREERELEYAVEWLQSPTHVWEADTPSSATPYAHFGKGTTSPLLKADAKMALAAVKKTEAEVFIPALRRESQGKHPHSSACTSPSYHHIWKNLANLKQNALCKIDENCGLVLSITQWIDADTLQSLVSGARALQEFEENLAVCSHQGVPCVIRTLIGEEFNVPAPQSLLPATNLRQSVQLEAVNAEPSNKPSQQNNKNKGNKQDAMGKTSCSCTIA